MSMIPISVTVILVIVVVTYLQLQRLKHERRLLLLSELIVTSQMSSPETQNRFIYDWVNILEELGYLRSLLGINNGVVFGSETNGRQAIFIRALNRINNRFLEDRHLALYVDMQQLISGARSHQWVSIEDLYRRLMKLPFVWYRTLAQHATEADEKLLMSNPYYRKWQNKLERILNEPLAEVNTLEIRRILYNWMDDCQIETITLFLDYFAELPLDGSLILLEKFKQTFPRGERVLLKLGGEADRLVVEQRTNEGRIGLQIHHDLLVDLDLEGLLTSPDFSPSLTDPRQHYLTTVLNALTRSSVSALVDGQLDWDSFFTPPDLWHQLFQITNYDIRLTGALLDELVPDWKYGQKVNRERLHSAWERVKARYGELLAV